MNRYTVEKGSDSGHCCFQWSVIDTSIVLGVHVSNDNYYYKCVCECCDEEDAENICNLLNKSVDSVDHP